MFAFNDLLLILQSHLIGRFVCLLTAQFERVCTIHEEVLDDTYEASLLHFFHVAILAAEIHKNSFSVRVLIDICTMPQEDVSHSDSKLFVLIVVFIFVESSKAVDQG